MVAQPVLKEGFYTGRDFYVPHFEVHLADQPLDRDVIHDVMQVTYKDSLTEMDNVQLTLNNWDAEQRAFKYSDGDLFLPGKRFALHMGYYGDKNMRPMLTGQITSIKPAFPSGAPSTIAIDALNALHSLRKLPRSQTFEGDKDSEIASKIIRDLGHKPIVDETAMKAENPLPHLFQDNKLDIIFLIERARAIGYDLFVQEEDKIKGIQAGIYFGPSQRTNQKPIELKYGAGLTEFSTNLETAQQVEKVTVLGWDNQKKAEIRYTARRNELTVKGVGSAGNQAEIDRAFSGREEIIADKPVATLDEAKKLATETLQDIAKKMLTANGSVVGMPDLRAGSVLLLDGLGTRFNGRYFVTSTTHTIGDSGYTTQFECRREELSNGNK